MTLEERLRAILAKHNAIDKRMFGGVCFMLNGNMVIGTFKDGLIVRVGKEGHAIAQKLPGATPFVMNGRAMAGYLTVKSVHVDDTPSLQNWLDLALAFNATLPAKPLKPTKPGKPKKKS